jgi:hypothetical protein
MNAELGRVEDEIPEEFVKQLEGCLPTNSEMANDTSCELQALRVGRGAWIQMSGVPNGRACKSNKVLDAKLGRG